MLDLEQSDGPEANPHLLFDLDDFPTNSLNHSLHNWKMNQEHYLPHRTAVRVKMKCAVSQWAFYSYIVLSSGDYTLQ